MHHYGEDSTIVQLVGTNFVLAFRNKVSGKELTFTVPVIGAKEDPDQRLTPQEARHLADEVAHLLRRTLE